MMRNSYLLFILIATALLSSCDGGNSGSFFIKNGMKSNVKLIVYENDSILLHDTFNLKPGEIILENEQFGFGYRDKSIMDGQYTKFIFANGHSKIDTSDIYTYLIAKDNINVYNINNYVNVVHGSKKKNSLATYVITSLDSLEAQ